MCAMAKVNFENSSVATKSKGISLGSNVNKKPGGLRHSGKLDKRTCSEISFKEFLNFLRTAYQINENIESNSTDINIDWNEVATSELVASLMGINQADLSRISQQCKEKLEENMIIKRDDNANNLEMSFYPIEKSMSSPLEKIHFNKKDSMADLLANKKMLEGSKSLEHIMKRKLNEVIQEGLLDSVLPYVVPKLGVVTQPLCKKTSNSDSKRMSNNADKNILNLSSAKDKNIASRRKSTCGEIEVEIHVCDEVKNLKRDFKCSQKLLVSKMGYFAEVTTANSNAGQKLEDMDISVHCDITIFDWLMRWVKKDINNESNPPTLDAGNVVPILVSAAFLQMDPLLEDCLEFCQRNINEIIKASTNLSCLNDNILTRLANMFSNSEVEALRDRKDKIQSKFYCKLIACLAEPNPESLKGHFASLAGLYQCSRCGKLILRQLASKIPCKANQMKMDTLGNVHNTHIRDLNWSLNDYVRSLKQELRTWRAVYWRLWGDCHYLSCSTCNNLFPTHQAQWCFHHADQPQFFTMEHQRTMTFPIGRYPCCGERAYRFEVLCSESGCQFKEHIPKLSTERDMAIHKIFSSHIKLIAVEPPLLMFPERLTRLVSSRDCLEGGRSGGRELQWWDGLELAPPSPKQSLFSRLWDREHTRKDAVMPATPEITSPPKAPTVMSRLPRKQTSVAADAGEGPVSSDDDSDSSAESDHSEESGHATVRVTTKPRLSEKALQLYAASNGRSGPSQWLSMLSIRNNQDNQREYEERAIYQISSLLTRRTCGDSAIIFQRNNNGRTHGNHHNSRWSHHLAPQGGTFIRLEHDWKEAHCHTFNCANARQRLVTSGMSVTRPKLRNRR